MKQADIQPGMRVFTYIGANLCAVIVVRPTEPDRYGKHKRFVVRRENEINPLPKPRTAAALREKDEKFFG